MNDVAAGTSSAVADEAAQVIKSQPLEAHANCEIDTLRDGDTLIWVSGKKVWKNNQPGSLSLVDGGTY